MTFEEARKKITDAGLDIITADVLESMLRLVKNRILKPLCTFAELIANW